MEIREKIVEFEKYCIDCKYYDKPETEEPCRECISTAARLYSHKPAHFKEK